MVCPFFSPIPASASSLKFSPRLKSSSWDRHSNAARQEAPWVDVMDAATHERCSPAQQPGAGREGGRAAKERKSPCSAASRAFPLCRAANQWNKKKNKKKEINNHHPLCLHLPLIYGPAEKPCCPQLLGSQLLFAMISSPLLSTRLPSRPHPATCRCTGLWQLPGCSVAGSQPCPVPWWDGYWVSGSGLILQGPGMAAGVQKQEQGCRRLGHRAARGKRAVRWTASKANQKITFCPELLKIQLYRTRNQKLSTRFPFWPS